MDQINKLLRRLTPGQIIAAGVLTWLVGLALVIFGLGPLAVTLLLPLGEATAAVVGFLVYFVGGGLVGHYAGKTFGRAYYDRKHDDMLHEIHQQFAAVRAQIHG